MWAGSEATRRSVDRYGGCGGDSPDEGPSTEVIA
jgi:hypothetical protein